MPLGCGDKSWKNNEITGSYTYVPGMPKPEEAEEPADKKTDVDKDEDKDDAGDKDE